MPAPLPLPSTADGDTLVLCWTPAVRGGRVQVAATDAFDAPLADLPVDGDGVTVHLHGLDASAVVWRVADADGAWSAPARTNDVAPLPAPLAEPGGTRLVWPIDGAPVDAGLVQFEWTTDDDGPVTVQVSADRGFARPLVSLDVTGTQLQIPNLLAETGRATYWRVGTASGWTPPARFRPSTDVQVGVWEAARDAARRRAALVASRAADAATAVSAPYLDERTSPTFVVGLLYAMGASFAFTVALLWRLTS